MKLFLVRPHPPAAILERKCPTPEPYRYDWQPMALKFLAYHLQRAFKDRLDIQIWHLMDHRDDGKLKAALTTHAPEVVVFSDLDILVNEISRWASFVKKVSPGTWTVVGGKQTSLLRDGDTFPFRGIDFAIRGEGLETLTQLVSARLERGTPGACPAVIQVDARGKVTGPLQYEPRVDLAELDGIKMQSFRVEGHSEEEYFTLHQNWPALISGEIRTATVMAGSGCPYRCVFCQSAVEHGPGSQLVMTRPSDSVASEIAWLVKRHQVNHIFSLEPNLNLGHWLKIYHDLELRGIPHLPVSGFVRADNILEANRKGVLVKLAQRGMRVLSVGLDVPLGGGRDEYGKSFSDAELMACLSACEALGIIALGTFIGDPGYTFQEMQEQLRLLTQLPVAAVDIRLSIALRNTEYFRRTRPWLVYCPGEDPRYFERQNYRYQTIRMPGRIQPWQTYRLVRDFYRRFLLDDHHLAYVLGFIRRFPESGIFFRQQYESIFRGLPEKPASLQELAEALGAGGAE